MQLCYIHFYQKIARKKVARVNAALGTAETKISNECKQPFFCVWILHYNHNDRVSDDITMAIVCFVLQIVVKFAHLNQW